MNRIVYTRPDGGLSVLHPIEGARLVSAVTYTDGKGHPVKPPAPADTVGWPINSVSWAETEDEFVARIAAKDLPPDAIDPQFVSAESVPTERMFREAWKFSGGKIEHDMIKVRERAHAMRRQQRAAKLAPLDDVIAKKIPGTDEAVAEAARAVIRQKYATVQAAIDQAGDVEAVKAALKAALL